MPTTHTDPEKDIQNKGWREDHPPPSYSTVSSIIVNRNVLN